MAHAGRHQGRSAADGTLVAALTSGATAVEAAEAAGVSVRTVRRRLGDPAFRHQLGAARSELLDVAFAKIASSAVAAILTLNTLMSSDCPASVRLGASKAILEYGLRLRAECEFADRLALIEEHLGLGDARG